MSIYLSSRLLLPKILAIVLLLVSFIPFHVKGVSVFFPMTSVMVAFYWGVYRPSLMENWFIFALGITQDLLTASPLGIYAFINLVVRNLAERKSSDYSKDSFVILWQRFIFFALLAAIIEWALMSIADKHIYNISLVFMQLLFTSITYPLFHALFIMVHTILPRKIKHA